MTSEERKTLSEIVKEVKYAIDNAGYLGLTKNGWLDNEKLGIFLIQKDRQRYQDSLRKQVEKRILKIIDDQIAEFMAHEEPIGTLVAIRGQIQHELALLKEEEGKKE